MVQCKCKCMVQPRHYRSFYTCKVHEYGLNADDVMVVMVAIGFLQLAA